MNTYLNDSNVHKTARNITVFNRAVRHDKKKCSVNVHTFNFHRYKIYDGLR